MDEQIIFELIGYAASMFIAISLMMKSLIRLRVINGLGALIFVIYGILIRAYPVVILNGIIVLIDLYYLIKTLRQQDYFTLMRISPSSNYLKYFLGFHKNDVQKFFPNFKYSPESIDYAFLVLRDTVPAAAVIIRKKGDCGQILLDYAKRDYRDFKIGNFLYDEKADTLINLGISSLEAWGDNPEHCSYLAEMGFKNVEENHFHLNLTPHVISDRKI